MKTSAQAHQLWTHDQKAYVEQERKKKEEKANLEKNLGKIRSKVFHDVIHGNGQKPIVLCLTLPNPT